MNIRVIGREVEVVYEEDQESSEHGSYTEFPSPKITLNTVGSQATQARTLVHEYFHALFRQVCDPDVEISEEQAARLFELGVFDLWVNNRELVEALEQESN